MTIKTKKYQLKKNEYIKMALLMVLKKTWWYGFGPLAFIILGFFVPYGGWYIGFGIIAALLFVAFWAIQFVGVTQMEQNKVMFEKLAYEIDSRFIVIKLNTKQGMQMNWDTIQKAEKQANAFLLIVNKAQFLHFPFSMFNSESDIKFFEALLKRKNLISVA
ncbi:MAG: YcxB family protein [Opitutaceae bacterium]|nr:YcxB family protein [Cytophagales bacterium]